MQYFIAKNSETLNPKGQSTKLARVGETLRSWLKTLNPQKIGIS